MAVVGSISIRGINFYFALVSMQKFPNYIYLYVDCGPYVVWMYKLYSNVAYATYYCKVSSQLVL